MGIHFQKSTICQLTVAEHKKKPTSRSSDRGREPHKAHNMSTDRGGEQQKAHDMSTDCVRQFFFNMDHVGPKGHMVT